ncbi:UDP-glucose/GDP-mannose dehydrogenase family protein [Peribacillus sp. FSL H8-0477]|uniref:UDP-glucose dehydrogenase family protein n=1 Tax=Peribacillus sp. FSL H8-0477 TaxID=2921388 RepID=UPI0030F81C97
MNIAVVGTGYVGLVTGVGLSAIGHHVTCIDIDEEKVNKMKQGISPIFEPGLEDLMKENILADRLHFTTNYADTFLNLDIVYIAVGTPENEDGTANLTFIDKVVEQIAYYTKKEIIVVTKSTVPVGTNHYIKDKLTKLNPNVAFDVVSNPEFLREGSAVYDVFHGSRIVIGSDSEAAAEVMHQVNEPFGIPIFKTDICSAEMIKYASNAFLATKISFINEIANVCEKVNADIEEVALGMGLDNRIGSQFLKAGIGYGGSCFPKDTKALKQIADEVDYEFGLLNAVIEFNNKQRKKLLNQALLDFDSLAGKNIGILGLAFKPDTDDIREAASLEIIPELVKMGANVKAYDPVAMDNAKKVLPAEVTYVDSPALALADTDLVFILTEWADIKDLPLSTFEDQMRNSNVYDGRNCFSQKDIQRSNLQSYYSIGRAAKRQEVLV